MAIQLPGTDRLPPGPAREFVSALHEIYVAAGQPPARAIARSTARLPPHEYQSVSHETISATLRGSAVPAWEKIRPLVQVLVSLSPHEYDRVDLLRRINVLWAAARTATMDDPAVEQPDPPTIQPQVIAAPAQFAPPMRIEPTGIVPPRPGTPASGIRSPLPRQATPFVGRQDLLRTMWNALQTDPDARFVLYGVVGSGKTQLARRFVAQHDDAYPVIWWVPAHTVESAHISLLELAAALDLPRTYRIAQTMHGVVQRLQSRATTYLLVFDDVRDERIRALVPSVGGHVIITTRDPAWAHDESSIGLEVPGFTTSEADDFLRACDAALTQQILRDQPAPPGAAPADRAPLTKYPEQVLHVLRQVGSTPLVLAQLVAWRRSTGAAWDVGDLLGSAHLHTGQPVAYPHTATISLLLAADRLEAANPAAMLLLEVLSWFGPASVSIALLRRASNASLPEPLGSALRDEVQLRRTLMDISRHGLLRLSTEEQRVELTPLTRLTLRHAATPEEARRTREQVHAVLAAADPGWPDDLESDEIHAEIAGHVVPTELVEAQSIGPRQLMFHQIRYRYLIGDYGEARTLGEAAVMAWRDRPLPNDDHLLLRTTQQLANALRAVGEYEQARTLTANAMSQLRLDPDYGEDHQHTLAMAGSRAADLRIAGEYRRALEIAEETCQRCISRYGYASARTTMSRHNLAVSLRLAGEFKRAEAEDRAALEAHRRGFGDANWRTLLSVNALAEDLFGLGRYAEALALAPSITSTLADAIHLPRNRMHRGVVLAGRTLALARRGLGQRDEALEQLRSHHAECRDLFGDRHEYTLAARMSYANTLHQLGRTDEAYQQAAEAFDTYRLLFGERNPLTLAAQVNIAVMLRARGELRRAWSSDHVAGEALRDSVGPLHPFTIAATVNLASDYALDSHPGTLTVSRRAYEAATKVHDGDHPDLLAATANLALDLLATGATTRAAELRNAALSTLHRIFGADHPMTETVAQGRRLDCAVEPPST